MSSPNGASGKGATGKGANGKAPPKPVRCAIYTRKSTTDGLDSDFNTLDAQRESAENYIKANAHQGWVIMADRYDDGGFTGGNIDRPALQRLLDDVDREKVDLVVVYKVDRLSRSLLDFARLVERFDERKVGFVSITQQFDTSSSMGRLVLNVLLSFAQFEREIISERTRDKIQAARRRGKWTGGQVCLGYRVEHGLGLVVVPDEADLVRTIFDLYLQTHSIGFVATRLNELGLTTKARESKKGRKSGARQWDKNSVYRVLRNVLYVGKVRSADGQLHVGEHVPLVTLKAFEMVADSMKERTTGRVRRNRKPEYFLTGLLRCGPCGAAMTSALGMGRSGKRYRYYRCVRQQAKGGRCPSGLLVAEEVEAAVVAQVKEVAARGEVRQRILERFFSDSGALAAAEATLGNLNAQIAERNAESKRVLAAFNAAGGGGGKTMAKRLGELEAETDHLRIQVGVTEERLRALRDAREQVEQVAGMLDHFDALWKRFTMEERRELLHLLVDQVVVDFSAGGLRIDFHDLQMPGAAVPTDSVGAEPAPAPAEVAP